MNFEQWFKVIDEGTDMPELMVQQAYELSFYFKF